MHTRNEYPGLRIGLAAAAGLLGLSLNGCGQRSAIAHEEAPAFDRLQPVVVVFAARETGGLADDDIVGDAGTLSSDIGLLIRVKAALDDEPGLKRFPLDVGVMRGVVTLYGEVDSPERYAQAVQIAQNVPGVQAVKSGIAVVRRV